MKLYEKYKHLRGESLQPDKLTYWLCVTNDENWEIVKRKKIWGVGKRSKGSIEQVRIDDVLIFYVMPKTIGGIFKCVSEPYEDQTEIFKWHQLGRKELFPYRVNIEPVIIPTELINIDRLIPQFRFINKKLGYMWSLQLRKGMLEIPESDYLLIKNHL